MDPFTQVYDALASVIQSTPDLRDMVRVANVVRFDDLLDRDPLKQQVQVADLPEVVLITEGAQSINLSATSSSTSCRRRYSWLMSTGDVRANKLLFPLQWRLTCALLGWAALFREVKWRGQHFVKNVSIVSAREGLSDRERNRGIRGWSSVWTCEVEMHFDTKEMRG